VSRHRALSPVAARVSCTANDVPAIDRTKRRSSVGPVLAIPFVFATARTGVHDARRANHQEHTMNEDRIKGQWKQLSGKIKEKWGKLTDDDMTQAEGSTEYLAGKVQERYGIARDEARRAVDDFAKTI
jgi:uncharacterized protein YjbJ (UPF0337 family)